MALEIKLNQKLSQSLVMTPQLQQAIKLLQLGRMEYLEMIEKELLENPLLEDVREGSGQENSSPGETSVSEVEERSSGTDENLTEIFAAGEYSEASPATSGDRGDENFTLSNGDWSFEGDGSTNYANRTQATRVFEDDEERPSLEATLTKPEGLANHLLWQLRVSDLSAEDREVAAQIIGNIDRNGYLSCSVEELVELTGNPTETVERVLKIIQLLDPIGIGARDLRECLLIQLEQQGLRENLAYTVVDKHLQKVELRRYDLIAKEESADIEDVYSAIRVIQKLEPRPGRPFVDEAPIYITPDIYVKKVGNDYVINLNEIGMPRLRLNSRYRELLGANGGKDVPDKEYLQDCMRSAAWLIKSIHQRQRTIYRVTESIMKFQRDFLEKGVSELKPLVLRDVAQDVGMHESTVSRVTTNKYVHTSQGVFELKFFFSSGLKSGQGEVSSESVKQKILDVINAEDPRHPMSDQTIVDQLRADGIDIARRTVAKYREALNILSSSRRKKVF